MTTETTKKFIDSISLAGEWCFQIDYEDVGLEEGCFITEVKRSL
jgi:hypothetical protein